MNLNAQNQTNQSNDDDFGIPPDYDHFAEDQGVAESAKPSSQSGQKKSFAYTKTEARAFLNGVVALPNGNDYVLELSLMSGGKGDKTNYLYGSFFVSKRLKRIAEKLVDVDFDEAGIVCEVEILNLHAEPSHGKEGRIFDNYKGFLVGLKFQ